MSELKAKLSHEQLFSSEPIYQVINAMDDYNRFVGALRHREYIEGQQGEEAPNLSLVRRSWPKQTHRDHHEKNSGYFNFNYFLVKQFGSSAKIVDRIRQDWDNWKLFLDVMVRQVGTKAVLNSANWIEMHVYEKPESNPPAVLLHHHLLQLFFRLRVDGFIPGTLYGYHNELKKFESGLPIAYIVETQSTEAGILPDLKIWPVTSDGQKKILPETRPQEGIWKNDTRERYLLSDLVQEKVLLLLFNHLERWFQEETALNADSTSRHYTGLSMIWIPVYDGWDCGRPIGCFLGWLFQFIPSIPEGLDTKQRIDANLHDYFLQCAKTTEYLAKDIYLAGGREIISQEFDSNEYCHQFLCKNIHLMEGWASATAKSPIEGSSERELPSDVLNALGYEQPGKQLKPVAKNFYYQKFDNNDCLYKLYVDLTSSQLERSDEGLERLLNEDPRILELIVGADFEVSENGFPEEYCNRIVNRLKTIYSRLKRTKGIIASAQLDIQKDLAATLSHTYTKVAEAVSNEIMMISPDTILDDIRRVVRMEEDDTELRKEIIKRVNEIDNRSRTRQLEYTFAVLSKGIKTHYKAVTMMDRMPPIRPGSVGRETLQEYITGKFYNSFLPLARNISSRSVRDAVAKIEKHYRPREGDQWWRQCIRFSGFGEEILLSPQPVESHRSSDVIDMFEDLKESVFFELFLNAFSNEALGYSMCDRLFIDIIFSPGIQFYTLALCNFVLVNRANLNDEDFLDALPDSWIEKKIERPSQHGGLSGWGMYGVKRSVENLLGLGQMFRYVNPSTQSGKIEIRLKPEWIGKK